MKNVTPLPRRTVSWRVPALVLAALIALGWGTWLVLSAHCRVLLPQGLSLNVPRSWAFYVPGHVHPENRPLRLDFRITEPPYSASRVPIGPPLRRLDSLLLVEVTSPEQAASVAVYYDAHLDFDGIHGGLDLPGSARVLQQIYRQQVLEAHRGTQFRFEWDIPEIAYHDGNTYYSQTYRRLPPAVAAGQAPTEYRMRVMVRRNAAIRIESKWTPQDGEDPQTGRELNRVWASLQPAA